MVMIAPLTSTRFTTLPLSPHALTSTRFTTHNSPPLPSRLLGLQLTTLPHDKLNIMLKKPA